MSEFARSTEHRSWPEYWGWVAMKGRCYNKANPCYQSYGGKGVRVCESWRESFVNFLNDMGRRPFEGATLDRIDPSGNYEKENCRWASRLDQSVNRSVFSSKKSKLPKGIHPSTSGKFMAKIRILGTEYYLGTFTEIEVAEKEYWKVHKEWYGNKYSILKEVEGK